MKKKKKEKKRIVPAGVGESKPLTSPTYIYIGGMRIPRSPAWGPKLHSYCKGVHQKVVKRIGAW